MKLAKETGRNVHALNNLKTVSEIWVDEYVCREYKCVLKMLKSKLRKKNHQITSPVIRGKK